MYHLVVVRRDQSRGDLSDNVQHARQRHGPHAADLRSQLDTVEVLHHQIGMPLRRQVEIQNLHDVRVVQLRGYLGFPLEALDHVGAIRDVGQQDLHGIATREPTVSGLVDFAHSAGANQTNDLIRVGEQRSWLESHPHEEDILSDSASGWASTSSRAERCRRKADTATTTARRRRARTCSRQTTSKTAILPHEHPVR